MLKKIESQLGPKDESPQERYSRLSVFLQQRKKGSEDPWINIGAAQDNEAGEEAIKQCENLQKNRGRENEMEFRYVPQNPKKD